MRFSSLLAGTAALFALVGSASVSPTRANDADTCVKGDGDAKITACTNAIQSGRWRGRDIAWAYVNRGWAYDVNEDYDRAIADESEAIRLDPNMANAYIYRGWAYDDKDQYDLAIADETEAIRLDPKDAVIYNNRGSAYVDKQDFERAVAEFTQAIQLAPKYAAAFRNRARAYLYTGKLANALGITVTPA